MSLSEDVDEDHEAEIEKYAHIAEEMLEVILTVVQNEEHGHQK